MDDTRKPLVSVYLVHRNYATHVKRAIDAVLAQSYTNIEFIIVDYGSDDAALCTLVRGIDNHRIKFYHHPCDHFIDAIKYAASKCNGTYIMRADADDWMYQDCIASMVVHAMIYDVDLVMASYNTDSETNVDPRTHMLSCQALINRQKFTQVVYLPDQTYRDGTALIATFAELGYTKIFVRDVLFAHHIHPNSLTAGKDVITLDDDIRAYVKHQTQMTLDNVTYF